eukprot:XP_011617567.1 PREDICTED: AT-rich interactive domain-containing protein 3A-like isoform X1 [Takifugu rubripes]
MDSQRQGHIGMVYSAVKDWEASEPLSETAETEKLFLRELYSYMKKRDSPIERIPNLGFKQIDLFLMFTTVRDLGGYQQVTAQQLWKQVYNTLGGNPRSTSAATCTRRHYERLLLPYEFHLKGLSLSMLPHHEHKHCHSSDYGCYGYEGPPAKCKIISVPQHQQNPPPFHGDQHGSAFRMPLQCPPYYHSPVLPPVLPPELPMAQLPQPAVEPYSQAAPAQEPLDNLRYLAECYKNSSGLTEPLNLSMKGPRRDPDTKPASSFSAPLSSKNPKFLNKPFSLYSSQCTQVVSGRREAQSNEAGSGGSIHSFPVNGQEAYAGAADSSSMAYAAAARGQTDIGADFTAPKPSSPKTDLVVEVKQSKSSSPDVSKLPLSHFLPGPPRRNKEGEVEIEVPLSALYNWLKQCRSPAAEPEQKPEEPSRQRRCFEAEDQPTTLTLPPNLQNPPQISKDPRPRQRTSPVIHPGYRHPHMSQSAFTASLHLPPGCHLKNATGQDLYGEQDANMSRSSQRPNSWDSDDPEITGPAVHRGSRTWAPGPSSVHLLDSSSTPVLQLSSEEVMKLKRIISSSL